MLTTFIKILKTVTMPVTFKQLEQKINWLMYSILTLLLISTLSFASSKQSMILKHEQGMDDQGKYQLEYPSLNNIPNQKGLTVKQSYAHVARACEYDIKLPCSTLNNYLKNDSTLKAYCK